MIDDLIIQKINEHINGSGLKKISLRAGAKRRKTTAIEKLREILAKELYKVVETVVTITAANKRKTVQTEDVYNGLAMLGTPVIIPDMKGNATLLKSCVHRKKRVAAEGEAAASPKKEASPAESPKKAHRFKPGTVALRQITRLQKLYCLSITKRNFEKATREVTDILGQKVRFQAGAIDLIQVYVENVLINVTRHAVRIAVDAAQRVTVTAIDIELAYTGGVQTVHSTAF